MITFKKVLTTLSLLSLLLVSCTQALEEGKSSDSVKYGSLTLSTSSSVRAVDFSSINKAKVSIIAYNRESITKVCDLSNGKGSTTIDNIPIGDNQVVKVEALDSNESALNGVVISAVTNIQEGNNSCNVTRSTTSKGKLMESLISNGLDTSKLSETDVLSLYALIPDCDASYFNSDALASDYIKGSVTGDYILEAGTLKVSCTNVSGYTLRLNDFVSKIVTVSSDGDYTITAPEGSWTLYITDADGNVETRSVTLASGSEVTEELSVVVPPTRKTPPEGHVVVFVKASSAPYFWCWEEDGVAISEKILGKTGWASQTQMDSANPEYMEDATGYFMYDINEYYPEYKNSGKPISFILNKSGTIESGMTDSFWYDGSKCYDSDPTYVSSDASVKVTGDSTFYETVTFTLKATNCTESKYTIDGTDPKSSSTAVSYTDGKTLTLGDDLAVGDKITVKVYGKASNGTVASASVTSEKVKYIVPTTPSRLGAYYTKTQTVFTIWSPESSNVTVTVTPQGGSPKEYTCTKGFTVDGGYSDTSNIYGVAVQGDLNLAEYQFKINGTNVRDPYGRMIKYEDKDAKTNPVKTGYKENGCTLNSYAGSSVNIVVDAENIMPSDGAWASRPAMANRADATIYEVHVGDFTADSTWGGSSSNQGKFPGMVESGTTYQGVTTGLDHLKELGITHVQIMPMYDFATKENTTANSFYNWGYDPVNYNVPEDRYSTCPEDYVARIREVKDMVNEFHKNGIRVIMDVVYNHTFDKEMFKNISGKYYTSTDLSGCGNSIDSSNAMVSRMIRDSLEYWAEVYNIDGFRFDLMAIYTKDSVKDWGTYLNSTNSETKDRNLLMYGEPWQCYGIISNTYTYASTMSELESGNIGCFAGKYRDTLKSDCGDDGGYSNGMYILNKTNGNSSAWNVKVGMMGSLTSLGSDTEGCWTRYFTKGVYQAINYVSCHDNLCIYDKLTEAGCTYASRAVNFADSIVACSQGNAFLYEGDEFLRTKKKGTFSDKAHNTYMYGQEINQIDWSLKVKNSSVYNLHKDLYALRNAHDGLRHSSSISGEVDGNIVKIYTKDSDGTKLCVVVNPGNNINAPVSGTVIFNAKGAASSATSDGCCEGSAVTVIKY